MLLQRIQRTWTLWKLLELIYGQVICRDTVITDQEEYPYHYQNINVTRTPVEDGAFSLPESEARVTISKLTDTTTKLQVHNI